MATRSDEVSTGGSASDPAAAEGGAATELAGDSGSESGESGTTETTTDAGSEPVVDGDAVGSEEGAAEVDGSGDAPTTAQEPPSAESKTESAADPEWQMPTAPSGQQLTIGGKAVQTGMDHPRSGPSEIYWATCGGKDVCRGHSAEQALARLTEKLGPIDAPEKEGGTDEQ